MSILSKIIPFLNKIYLILLKSRLKVLGYKYVVNNHTDEIHKLSNIKTNCHLELMTDINYVKSSEELLKDGYNGCRWCYNETDTDK